MSEADKIIKNLKNSGKKVEEFYVSNKTSDNNVGSIEKISQTSDKNVANDSVIAHKFATMQQQIDKKDKRIQELEEENLIQRKQIMNIFDNDDYIPMQVVIDKMEELNKEIKSCDEIDAIFKIKQQQILQELLEGAGK